MEKQVRLKQDDTLYLLGDYINKGPNSKGVIDFIWELRNSGYVVHCLRGNHEQYLIDGLDYSWEEIAFRNRGGLETMQSFGISTIHEIPTKYLDFITALPFYIELESFLLIHAGLNFDLADPFKDDFSMLNIRKMHVDLEKTGGRVLIHGHVPTPASQIEKDLEFEDHHVSIDGGCVYTHLSYLQQLVALDIGTRKLYLQNNID